MIIPVVNEKKFYRRLKKLETDMQQISLSGPDYKQIMIEMFYSNRLAQIRTSAKKLFWGRVYVPLYQEIKTIENFIKE